jgi:hypothetical protein
VRHGIVEGEPGIFPAPVAKVMRAIGGLFGKKKPSTPSSSTGPAEDTPYSDLDPKPPGTSAPAPDDGSSG